MRKEDTPSFLAHFLGVRAAPLIQSFRDWGERMDHLNAANHGLGAGLDPVADHFSYKCREVREYDELRSRFEEHSDDGWRASRFVYQSIISGRRVAVIGLVDPIVTPLGDLRVLELAEPKPMSAAPDGFDHVEISTRQKLEFMVHCINDTIGMKSPLVKKGRPHHTTWDAVIMPDRRRKGRQPFILRLNDAPLVEKIGREML